jgi:hypothetical protein
MIFLMKEYDLPENMGNLGPIFADGSTKTVIGGVYFAMRSDFPRKKKISVEKEPTQRGSRFPLARALSQSSANS